MTTTIRKLVRRAGHAAGAASLIMSLSACETAKRFAPPGFVKYEDLEKGIPVNPAIQRRINEAPSGQTRYPILAQTPQAVQVGLKMEEREGLSDTLLAQGDLVLSDIARARTQMEAEFGLDTQGNVDPDRDGDATGLPDSVLELERRLEEIRSEVEEEASKPLPAPLDTTGAPEQDDPF